MKRFAFVMLVSLCFALILFLILNVVEPAAGPLETPQTTMTPTFEPTVTQVTIQQVAAVEYTRYSTSWTYADLINQLINDGFTSFEAMYAADHCGLMG